MVAPDTAATTDPLLLTSDIRPHHILNWNGGFLAAIMTRHPNMKITINIDLRVDNCPPRTYVPGCKVKIAMLVFITYVLISKQSISHNAAYRVETVQEIGSNVEHIAGSRDFSYGRGY